MISGQTLFVFTMCCLLYMIYTINHYTYCKEVIAQGSTDLKHNMKPDLLKVCQFLKNTINPNSNSIYKYTIEYYYNLMNAAKFQKFHNKFIMTEMGKYEVFALKYVHLSVYLVTLYYCFLIFPSIIFEIIKKFFYFIVYLLLFCVLIELIMQELDTYYNFGQLFETKTMIKRMIGFE